MNQEEENICKAIHHFIIFELEEYIDEDIFLQDDIIQLGQFYFDRILISVSGATDKLIKVVIRSIASRDPNFSNLNDYYTEICNILDFDKLPKDIYSQVLNKFDIIFKNEYVEVCSIIDNKITSFNEKLRSILLQENTIKNFKSGSTFMRDLSDDETRLNELYTLCNSLRTAKEMVQYSKQYMTDCLMSYCDFNDANIVTGTLRIEALKLSKRDSFDISLSFLSYSEAVSITKDIVQREYAIFFKVKIYQLADEANKNAKHMIYIKSDEEIGQLYKEAINKLPEIDNMQILKTTSPQTYLTLLKRLSIDYDILNVMKDKIENCVCLRNRKDILIKTLKLFQDCEMELFDNIIPVQIEGMFDDFLKDTTTFSRFNNLNLYTGAVLREKIQYLKDYDTGIYPEAVLYFMYYFNNIVRNKVAHGNYRNIFRNLEQAEIFAYELLLDLNFMIHMLSRRSETEKMYRFIHGYKAYCQKYIKSNNPHFGSMFNDLIGAKFHSDYDYVGKYRPIQVTYWLVNPYYEKIYEAVADKTELIELRNDLLSPEFWEYALGKLKSVKETGWDYLHINSEFNAIINGLFNCNISLETKKKLGQVNAILKEISHLRD